jgi:hypothetical protein
MSAITSTSTFHKDLIVVDHSRLDGMSQGELVELAKDINGKAIKAAKQTLIHAGQTGIVLIALKAKIPHGQFLKYVEHLTEIPPRTAQTYMSIATNYATVAHLRGVRDAIRYIRESSGRANKLTAIESPPAPAPRPSPVPVILDAEIVGPSAPAPAPAPAPQDDEPEPLVVDGEKPQRTPSYIPSDALDIWNVAKTHLNRILKNDIHREQALNACISYCHGRLETKRDALAAIVATIPRLTKDEIKSLIETLNTRWK